MNDIAAFSPDEEFLYIAESGRRVWLRDRVQPDRSVSDGILFLDPSSDKAPGGPDGRRVDKQGNLYGSGPGGVWIISPEGKHIGTIRVPEPVSNVAWGDRHGQTLYTFQGTREILSLQNFSRST
jgi:gluconolactonase